MSRHKFILTNLGYPKTFKSHMNKFLKDLKFLERSSIQKTASKTKTKQHFEVFGNLIKTRKNN
jgi:hypothetical protein